MSHRLLAKRYASTIFALFLGAVFYPLIKLLNSFNSRRFVCGAAIASACFLSSCAFGHKTQYTGGFALQPIIPSHSPLVVAVQDARPEVVSGSKSDTTVGVLRSIAGVPWPVKTLSGRPLALDIGESLVQTLSTNGYKASQLQLFPQATEEDLKKLLAGSPIEQSSKVLHLIIREWDHHTWFGSGFDYCADLKVRALNGLTQATTTQCGKTDLPSSDSQFADLRTSVATVVGRLVNAKETVEALQASDALKKDLVKGETHSLGQKAAKKCTTAQILTMKRLNFSDEQIAQSCP